MSTSIDFAPHGSSSAEPGGLVFTEAAEAGGTDRDVLIGYQLFLGRDPESSAVIADAKLSPVGAFIRALIASGEFQSSVRDRLAAQRPVPHEAGSPGPSPAQLDWLFTLVRLPAQAERALRGRQDWRDWLRMFTSLPGLPTPPERAGGGDTLPEGAGQTAIGDGFVLITLESPKPGEAMLPGGSISGSGWVIAPSDVSEVAITLDDKLLTHARYGLPRPDVARRFAHYRHVDHCGFSFTADIPAAARLHGESRLGVLVRTVAGERGEKRVRLRPPADKGAPGFDAWPIRLSVEAAEIGPDRVLRLRGWAVSRGDLRGIAIMLGDHALGEAEPGLKRPDIALAHPDYPNAAQSGFSFAADLPPDLPPGPGFVRVQVRNSAGQQRQTIVPVTIPARAAPAPDIAQEAAGAGAGDSQIRCHCDSTQLLDDGNLLVDGWALAPSGIVAIEVIFDGQPIGTAELGRARADVGRHFRDDPRAATAGFAFAHRLAEPPAPGAHLITLDLRESSGASRRIALQVTTEAAPSITVPPAREPTIDDSASPSGPSFAAESAEARPHGPPDGMRLEIDRPALHNDSALEAVRGALTISGWALARSGLTDIEIYAGERRLGRAYRGMRREDIALLFADYPDALLAGWALVLPPGALPPGAHRIRVIARASAAEAMLERAFTLVVDEVDTLPPEAGLRVSLPPAERAFALRLLARQGSCPRFHIILAATPDADAGALATSLASLRAQAYPDWTASTAPSARSASIPPQIAADARIFAPPNHPAPTHAGPGRSRKMAGDAAPQAALKQPEPDITADHVLRLRAGDRLGVDALLYLAIDIATHPKAAFIYTDDLRPDPATPDNPAPQPWLKPDWSPVLLRGTNYIGRAWCASAALIAAAGLTAKGLAALSDYDLVLRLTEQTEPHHLPRVLFAQGPVSDAQDQQSAALHGALARQGIAADILPIAPALWRVRAKTASPAPVPARAGSKKATARKAERAAVPGRVSVIIPTCGAREMIRTAIAGLRATDHPDLEIIVLDNTPRPLAKLSAWLRKSVDIVLDMPGPFNWSRFNNEGARVATGEFLLFLNDDIEIKDPTWLCAMLEHARRPEVGVVGARLLYPDGKLQHGGQFLADMHALHAFRFADADSPGPFGLAAIAREMIAVTGACQLIRAATFTRLGGFEEAHGVVNNDLDFCLRSWRAGLAVIYTPHATLIHHELVSRARLEDQYDAARFAGAWRTSFLAGDPFRNKLHAPTAEHYGIEAEPAIQLFVGRRGPARDEIRRILAIKLDHIGDFLTALPALRALKRRFPQARIDLLAPAASLALAAGEPAITETIQFDFFHARSGDGQKGIGEAELLALRDRLAPRAYDIAIDLRMQSETREVLRYTGAAFLAGYDQDNRFPFLDVALVWEGDTSLAAKRGHVSERLTQLVAAVEEACSDPLAPSPPPPLSVLEVPALARLPATFRARPLVCVHPGVGNVVRQWPAAHYAALIDLLVERAGVHVVLIGAREEAAIAEDIMRQVIDQAAVESLVGRVKLADLSDVMRACVLFVGNNSGPQHLAGALGLPTIGIHSGVVDASEWAPLGENALAIRRRMICSPCYLEFAADCPRHLACLTGLRPRDVFAACLRMLPAK